jgi:aspartate racemase
MPGMRLIGLLGGMSWESSAEYYRLVNTEVAARLGGYHSARCLLHSVDFAPIEDAQRSGDWDAARSLLVDAARSLRGGGAELVVLCTNTMHRLADDIADALDVPFLHIAATTATAIQGAGVRRIGLLGTRYTMEQEFYRGRLAEHGIDVLVPDEPDRTDVHRIIYDELVHGSIRPESRERYRAVMTRLVERGAAGMIYGCTEITLLVGPDDTSVPVFDTTRLHAAAAVDAALA